MKGWNAWAATQIYGRRDLLIRGIALLRFFSYFCIRKENGFIKDLKSMVRIFMVLVAMLLLGTSPYYNKIKACTSVLVSGKVVQGW